MKSWETSWLMGSSMMYRAFHILFASGGMQWEMFLLGSWLVSCLSPSCSGGFLLFGSQPIPSSGQLCRQGHWARGGAYLGPWGCTPGQDGVLLSEGEWTVAAAAGKAGGSLGNLAVFIITRRSGEINSLFFRCGLIYWLLSPYGCWQLWAQARMPSCGLSQAVLSQRMTSWAHPANAQLPDLLPVACCGNES